MSHPRVLLVGAGGQVGRELQAIAPAFPVMLIPATREQCDVRDAKQLGELVAWARPDLIINTAGFTQVDPAEQFPAEAMAVNRDGVRWLADAGAALGIPVFHLSTDYVFDGSAGRPYREDDPPAPLGVYGQSKWLGEIALRETLAEHLCLRVSWVFGRFARNFVHAVLAMAKTQTTLRIVADQVSAPTPAKALAQTLLSLARRYSDEGALPWGTYHYCGMPHASRFEFAEAILARASELGLLTRRPELLPVTSQEFAAPAPRPLDSRLDADAFVKAFGWALPDWRDALDDVLMPPDEGV